MWAPQKKSPAFFSQNFKVLLNCVCGPNLDEILWLCSSKFKPASVIVVTSAVIAGPLILVHLGENCSGSVTEKDWKHASTFKIKSKIAKVLQKGLQVLLFSAYGTPLGIHGIFRMIYTYVVIIFCFMSTLRTIVVKDDSDRDRLTGETSVHVRHAVTVHSWRHLSIAWPMRSCTDSRNRVWPMARKKVGFSCRPSWVNFIVYSFRGFL